jgi:thymidylate synthase (FAD)
MKGEIQVQLQDSMGSDRSIAEAAWTSSYDLEKRELKTDEDVERVVRMIITSGHSVPVESVVFRFWFRFPIFTDRQHMTHRIASHSGLSGRYRTMPDDWFSVPDDVVKIMDKVNHRYGHAVSSRFDQLMEAQNKFYREELEELKKAQSAHVITNAEYKRCREILRGVLGTSLMTERTTVMNLRSFANFIKLRLDPHAQTEIRLVAEKMLNLVTAARICPVAIECLMERNWIV